nr:MAG TPA_asm: type I neck protein [Caudoviricetes sp.]
MVKFYQKGDYSKLTGYLEKLKEVIHLGVLDKYGQEGVRALSSATPVDSGLTAESWYYRIENRNEIIKIGFYNSNIQKGCPIAIILQYGHGTKNRGWVAGTDYINPAIQPIFERITNDAWREVAKL